MLTITCHLSVETFTDSVLEQRPKLLQGQTGVADDAAHRESVYWIMAGDSEDAHAIRHDDVLALSHDPESGLLQGAHRIEVVDAG